MTGEGRWSADVVTRNVWQDKNNEVCIQHDAEQVSRRDQCGEVCRQYNLAHLVTGPRRKERRRHNVAHIVPETCRCRNLILMIGTRRQSVQTCLVALIRWPCGTDTYWHGYLVMALWHCYGDLVALIYTDTVVLWWPCGTYTMTLWHWYILIRSSCDGLVELILWPCGTDIYWYGCLVMALWLWYDDLVALIQC